MSGLLEDKVAMITGAAAGIGRAAAIVFAREGATVVLADVDVPGLQETVSQVVALGGKATAIPADVSRREDVRELVGRSVGEHGRLDVAFNNAGVAGLFHPLVDYPDDQFELVLATNVRGTWYCLQEEIPVMAANGGGAILNASSGLGVVGCSGMPAYVASKHAVLGLTQAAAIENAKEGVRINALLPGITATSQPLNLLADSPGLLDTFKAAMPIGRLAEPAEIAEAAAWLCSDRASFVTGHGMAVDGGYLSQ